MDQRNRRKNKKKIPREQMRIEIQQTTSMGCSKSNTGKPQGTRKIPDK